MYLGLGIFQIELNGGDEFCDITVTDPQKTGDGMGSYITYKVNTKTNLKYFRRGQFTVVRRFSDFLGLHDKLVDKHLHSGYIIPPAPEKDMVGKSCILHHRPDYEKYMRTGLQIYAYTVLTSSVNQIRIVKKFDYLIGI